MLKQRLLFFFLVCSLPLAAAERAIELDPARTTIGFTVDSSLHTVHGSFKLKRGSLKFDTAAINSRQAAGGRDCATFRSGCRGGFQSAEKFREHRQRLIEP